MRLADPSRCDGVTLGTLFRQKRKVRGLSAREVSIRSGLSESYVGKLEAGRLQPSLQAFAQLAVALEFSKEEVFFLVLRLGRRG